MLGAVLLSAAALAGELDAAGVSRTVAAQRGRAVVLNVWATWCAPCVEELPDLIALARERKGVAIISVSIDEPEDRAAVAALIERLRPPFPVYVKAKGSDEAFIEGVDPAWSGAVPLTIVFDAAGKKRALLEGEHTRREIEAALDQSGEEVSRPQARCGPGPFPGR